MNQKVLFIHIAKAAGSSINRFFIERYPANKRIVHVEIQKELLKDESTIDDKDFISGHITYREFKSRLEIEKYFTFTCLREPLAHVISHLAWIRKLADPGERQRFEAHPPYVQKLSSKMLLVDFSLPSEVRSFVELLDPVERRLLDNVQVNYLHEKYPSNSIAQAELESALNVVDRLDLVGIVENIDLFYRVLAARLGLSPVLNIPHENKQSEKYGMNAADAEFQAAVEPLIKYDRILYQNAKKKFLSVVAQEEDSVRTPLVEAEGSVRGVVDQVSPELIHGWCMRSNTTIPVNLALYINDEQIATTEASLPRPDVHGKGIHPTGFCGFRFKPCGQFVFRPGDIVSVKVIGRNHSIELTNSPMTI